jgi:hypothetical protein
VAGDQLVAAVRAELEEMERLLVELLRPGN